jgi:hypothetical protein
MHNFDRTHQNFRIPASSVVKALLRLHLGQVLRPRALRRWSLQLSVRQHRAYVRQTLTVAPTEKSGTFHNSTIRDEDAVFVIR